MRLSLCFTHFTSVRVNFIHLPHVVVSLDE